jgi:hypothetical protein
MGIPTSEVGYTSATTGRGDHEVHKGHVVALGEREVHFKANNVYQPHGNIRPILERLTIS